MPWKGSCLSWLDLRIKHWDLSLPHLQVLTLTSTSQPGFQGVVLLHSWLHYKIHFCLLICAQAPLIQSAWVLLPALSNPISVSFLIFSLCLQLHKSWTGRTPSFSDLSLKSWCSAALLTNSASARVTHFLSPSHSPSHLSNPESIKFYLMDKGLSSLLTKTDSYVCKRSSYGAVVKSFWFALCFSLEALPVQGVKMQRHGHASG